VVLNVISVGAAWGVLDLVWQRGHGSDLIWGIPATGSVNAWLPLMVFAFLFRKAPAWTMLAGMIEAR
jgi:RND superfamily putative drug exporter